MPTLTCRAKPTGLDLCCPRAGNVLSRLFNLASRHVALLDATGDGHHALIRHIHSNMICAQRPEQLPYVMPMHPVVTTAG